MVNGKNWKELREIRKMAEARLIPMEAVLSLIGIEITMIKDDDDDVSVTREGRSEKEPLIGFVDSNNE